MLLLNLVNGDNSSLQTITFTTHMERIILGVSIVVDKSCQTNWQYALEKVDVNKRYVVLKIIGEYKVCLQQSMLQYRTLNMRHFGLI